MSVVDAPEARTYGRGTAFRTGWMNDLVYPLASFMLGHCTDGRCTHEHAHLADGLVMGHVIECPKHNGQFDYRTGAPLRAPVCEALHVYPTRVAGDRVLVRIEPEAADTEGS